MAQKSLVTIKPSSRKLEVTTKRSRRWVVPTILMIAILIISGAAILIYNRTINNPEKILVDALLHSFDEARAQKPTTIDGTFSLEVKGDQPLMLTFQVLGNSEGDSGGDKADISLTFKNKTYVTQAEAVFDSNDDLYLKLTNLKDILSGISQSAVTDSTKRQTINQLASTLDGKWIQITKQDLESYTGINNAKVEQCVTALKQLVLTSNDQKELKKDFNVINPLTIINTKTEESNGEQSFYYNLDFSRESSILFIQKAAKLKSFSDVKNRCGFNEQILNVVPNSQPKVELWIDKKSRRINQFRITINNKNITIDMMNKFNTASKQTDVSKPAESIPLKNFERELKSLSENNISNL